jgi:hypothetical protein
MPGFTPKQPLTVVEAYDVAADAKKRISLRNAKTKYFHVKALSNGSYYLEPRVLVSPQAISARSLKMLDKSVANLKKELASAPIDQAGWFLPPGSASSKFGLTDIAGDVILYCMEIVQDTNVFVAALRSQEGASADVLDRCWRATIRPSLARLCLRNMRN